MKIRKSGDVYIADDPDSFLGTARLGIHAIPPNLYLLCKFVDILNIGKQVNV